MAHDRLSLWLADTWVEALSSGEGPTGQVKKLFEFAEGLLELLSVGFLATALAHRDLVDGKARARLAQAAVHAFGKRAGFGDWQQIVEAGYRSSPRLREFVTGQTDEPQFAAGSAVARCMTCLHGDTPERIPLTRFFASLVHERNDFTHRRADVEFNSVLSPLLREALELVIAELQGFSRRPLCHVEQAEVHGPDEFVVRYRHLVGNAKVPDRQKSFSGDGRDLSWHRGLMAFWDGESRTPTPVPRWLAHFNAKSYVLWMCQGTDPRRQQVLFHARQPKAEPAPEPESTDALWQALATLGATAAPPPVAVAVVGIPTADSTYSRAYHRALLNDGRITHDEADLLDGLAQGLALTPEHRRQLEGEVRSSLGKDFTPGPAVGAPRPAPAAARRLSPLFLAAGAALLLTGAGTAWWTLGRWSGGGMPEVCYNVSDCPDDLDCQSGKCVPFPPGPGGDAARAYKRFSVLRNTQDREGFREAIKDPIECWFYTSGYDREKFIQKRFPSEGSKSLHVIKELIIVSESSIRVTLQNRGRVGNHCHDTTVLMVLSGGGWKFSGEGAQRKVSEQGSTVKRDCWVELGGPAAEARFGRYCPPVK